MPDPFASNVPGLTAPGVNCAGVTPHDSNELDPLPRALWIGTAGRVDLVGANGATVAFKNASGLLPFRAKIVKATNLTAADIVAIW
jgi:hypothetical protein